MREESDFIHEIFFTYFLAIIGVILVAQHLTEMRFMIWSKRVFTKIINREFHLADLSGTLNFLFDFWGFGGFLCWRIFVTFFCYLDVSDLVTATSQSKNSAAVDTNANTLRVTSLYDHHNRYFCSYFSFEIWLLFSKFRDVSKKLHKILWFVPRTNTHCMIVEERLRILQVV